MFVPAFVLATLIPGCGPSPDPGPADEIDLAFNLTPSTEPVATRGEPIFTDQPIFEHVPGRTGHHGASITAFADGGLLAAWYGYQGPHELEGSAIYLARRLPETEAWEPPALHIERPVGDGNPVLYREGDKVWLFQAVVPWRWSSSGIEMQISDDRGRTWSEPQSLGGPLGSNTRFPPIRLTDGTLLLPAYDDLFQQSLFFSSTDGSAWELSARVATAAPHQNIQPSVVQLDGGRLVAVMRNTGAGWLWVTASDDGGSTWSAPIDSGFRNPGSPAALMRTATGRLVLVFNDSPAERTPLTAALSDDEGRTWPHRRVLAEDDRGVSYPGVAETPDGSIHVVYSLGREHIRHATVNEAWITGDGS